MNLPVVASALRRLGLVAPRLRAYGHTSIIAHLPRIKRQRAWSAITPPAAIPWLLWCDGVTVPAAFAHAALGSCVDPLVAAGLLAVSATHVRAPFAVVPVDHGFLCFDFDHDAAPHVAADDPPSDAVDDAADIGDARVCWPDDSSHHLLGALPCAASAGVARWLDVGAGPAFAPLHRPRLAGHILATDINPRALTMATLGLGLSQLTHIQVMLADGTPTSAGMFDLISCNAPIPAPVTNPTWHFAPPQVLQDFIRVAPTVLQPHGTIILHALLNAPDVELLQRHGGAAHIVGYTDAMYGQSTAPGFAVLWWQPHRPGPCTVQHRELTSQRPHIDAADHPTWWTQAV